MNYELFQLPHPSTFNSQPSTPSYHYIIAKINRANAVEVLAPLKELLYRLMLLDIGQLQSVALALVLFLEGKGEHESDDAEASEYAHREGVVVLLEYLSIDNTLTYDAVLIEHPADEQGHEAKTDVLHPEDEGIGRSEQLLGDNLGN